MRSRQVPRAEWFSFFRAFSQRHEDSPVSVRVIHPRLGSQIEVTDLPLEGVVSDREGRGPISIYIGRDPRDHVEHEIENPSQIWVEMADDGTEEALNVESTDGTKTILQFRARALPDSPEEALQP